MMGRTCLSLHGDPHEQTNSVCVSKTDEIMSKYRPIAPKPSSLCKSISDCNSVLEFGSAFAKGNTVSRSGYRRRASDCSSPRVLKRTRAPSDDERGTHSILAYPSDGSFSTEKLSIEKDSGFMKRAAAAGKAMMNSTGEVGIENSATIMEDVSVPKMSEIECGCGSAKYFVFPIVGDIQQQNEMNLVTLPLLPPPSSPSSTEDIRLRVFGKDLSHYKEVEASQIATDESPKPATFVPIAGLSFL